MQHKQLTKTIYSYYESLKSLHPDTNGLTNALLEKIILDKGSTFVEQKFFFIVECINHLTEGNFSSKELYAKIFPNLTPTRQGIDSIFDNAIKSKNFFSPLYDSSECLYCQWLINFETCFLVNNVDGNITINEVNCTKTLDEFKVWTHEVPQIKGSSIRSNIKWDLGELPLDTEIQYSPKNPSIRKDILLQLEKHGVMQIITLADIKNRIEIKLQNSNIILTRKSKYPVTPKTLQAWLSKFGIAASLITTTYLIEYGMPYGGNLISLDEILRYTNNGYGIIGLLAFQLSLLIAIHESGQKTFELRNHPLSQSVVLGFARLEHYLNPTTI